MEDSDKRTPFEEALDSILEAADKLPDGQGPKIFRQALENSFSKLAPEKRMPKITGQRLRIRNGQLEEIKDEE